MNIHFSFSPFPEIYQIVSEKQIRDSPDVDNSPSNNAYTITPTINSSEKKKPCCNS